MTYEHPWYTQQQLLESTTTCELESTPKQSTEQIGRKFTNKSRLGDISEHLVITEALQRGAEVFPNCTCTGTIDLIIKINDQHLDCDVKTMTQRHLATGRMEYYHTPKSHTAEGVHCISVNPETHSISWHPSLTPKGFETFWDKTVH